VSDDYEPEPCGEGMCQCHCDGGHVCGCDCWRCDECQQLSENCHCEGEDYGCIDDVYSASELAEMDRDAEFRMDAADEARDAEMAQDGGEV
jgi:hypothetical protein